METKNYSLYEKVFSQKEETETEFEELLPEYLPGNEKIISAKAIPVVRYEHFDDEKLIVSVRVIFKILYVSDYKKQLKCASFSADEDFTFSFPPSSQPQTFDENSNLISDCTAVCTYISAGSNNPRSINVRARICVNASVYKNAVENLPKFSNENDGLICLERAIPTVTLSQIDGEEIRIVRELELENSMPSISEIVDAYADMCVCNVKTESSGKAIANGKAVFHALYRANDDTYVSLVQDYPFSSEIISPTDSTDSEEAYKVIVTPISVTADISQDNYGENRGISLSVTSSVKALKYSSQSAVICEDAFCKDCDCTVNIKAYPSAEILDVFEENFSLEGGINASGKEIAQIIESSAYAFGAYCECSEDKVVVNFKLALNVLGMTPNGEFICTDGTIPMTAVFSKPLKLTHSSHGTDSLNFDVSVCVSGVNCEISAGEIKCALDVCIRSTITKSAKINGVGDVESDGETCVKSSREGLVIYYPSPNDTLWSVAKRYRTSPESIAVANKISGNSFTGKIAVIPPN